MAKKLANRLSRSAQTIYETESFRREVLLHLNILHVQKGNSSIEITQDVADKWWGDFYGLLLSQGIRPHMLWVLTVFNGLTNSGDYNSDFLEIKTPDIDYMNKLVDIHNTIHIY